MAALALLCACQPDAPAQNDTVRPPTPLADENAAAGSAPAHSDNSIQPDEMKGEVGARHVLGLWAEALERGDWASARAQWGEGGAMSGRTPAQFAAEYARYRQIKIDIDKGEADAGAGSLFYMAPVRVSGITREGQPFDARGTAHLRRVNDVPGASAEQLRWHIERMDFPDMP